MTLPQFSTRLGILTLVLIGLAMILSKFGPFADTLGFSIATIVVFAVVTLGLFFMGLKTVDSSNKNLFLIVAMGSIFVKLLLTLIILFTYRTIYGAESKSHLLLFLFIYLAYTIFETFGLMRLSKMKEK